MADGMLADATLRGTAPPLGPSTLSAAPATTLASTVADVHVFRAPDGTAFTNAADYKRFMMTNFLTVHGVKDARVVRTDIGGQPFQICKSVRADVCVLDVTSQIVIEDLEECRVFIGPCSGAVFIKNCFGCIFTVACHQLRLRDCEDCIVCVHTQCEPVIDASMRITFGPFNGAYPQLRQHMKAASLNEKVNRWSLVTDFSADNTEDFGPLPHWRKIDTHAWESDGADGLPGGAASDTAPETQFHATGADVTHLRRAGAPAGDAANALPAYMRMSALVRLSVATLLDRFDADADGAWDFNELNAFQAATGDEDRVADAAEMRQMLTAAKIPIDAGKLRYRGLLTLYDMQGCEALARDLAAIGARDIGPGRFPTWTPKYGSAGPAGSTSVKPPDVSKLPTVAASVATGANSGVITSAIKAIPLPVAGKTSAQAMTRFVRDPHLPPPIAAAVPEAVHAAAPHPPPTSLPAEADASAASTMMLAPSTAESAISRATPPQRVVAPGALATLFSDLQAAVSAHGVTMRDWLAKYDTGRDRGARTGRITAGNLVRSLTALCDGFDIALPGSVTSNAVGGSVDDLRQTIAHLVFTSCRDATSGAPAEVKASTEIDYAAALPPEPVASSPPTTGRPPKPASSTSTVKPRDAGQRRERSASKRPLRESRQSGSPGEADLNAPGDTESGQTPTLVSPAAVEAERRALAERATELLRTHAGTKAVYGVLGRTGMGPALRDTAPKRRASSRPSSAPPSSRSSVQGDREAAAENVEPAPGLLSGSRGKSSSSRMTATQARRAERMRLLQRGEVDALADMLIEDFITAMRKSPDLYSKFRRRLDAAPAFTIVRPKDSADSSPDGAQPQASEEDGDVYIMAPSLQTLLTEVGLQWPLPIVAIAAVKLGGRLLLTPRAMSSLTAAIAAVDAPLPSEASNGAADTTITIPPPAVETLSDYTRVVISQAVLQRVVHDAHLSAFSARGSQQQAWLANKAEQQRAQTAHKLALLRAALASASKGVPTPAPRSASDWLSRADVQRIVEQFEILPEVWTATEAAALADTWLRTSREGRAAVRAEELRLAASHGEGAADDTELLMSARAKVLTDKTSELIEQISSTPQASLDMFWQYVGDTRSGKWPTAASEATDPRFQDVPTTPACTRNPDGFDAWLRWREVRRRRRLAALQQWHQQKQAELEATKEANRAAAPIETIERVVTDLATKSQKEMFEGGPIIPEYDAVSSVLPHDGRSVMSSASAGGRVRAVHPSRAGLELTARLARLKQRSQAAPARADARSTSPRAASASQSVLRLAEASQSPSARARVVRKADFDKEFGPALFSLLADPDAAPEARALLDARGAARRMMHAKLNAEGPLGDAVRTRLVELRANIRADAAGSMSEADIETQCESRLVDELAARLMEQSLPKHARFAPNFNEAAAQALTNATEKRAAATQRFEEWQARKSAEARSRKQEEARRKDEAAAKKAARAQECERRFTTWKKDAARRYDLSSRDPQRSALARVAADDYAHAGWYFEEAQELARGIRSGTGASSVPREAQASHTGRRGSGFVADRSPGGASAMARPPHTPPHTHTHTRVHGGRGEEAGHGLAVASPASRANTSGHGVDVSAMSAELHHAQRLPAGVSVSVSARVSESTDFDLGDADAPAVPAAPPRKVSLDKTVRPQLIHTATASRARTAGTAPRPVTRAGRR